MQEASLPTEIDDSEKIVRAVKRDFHLNRSKDTLTYKCFMPRKGSSAVSVIRQRMGDSFCKKKSKELFADQYFGLAVLEAGKIRQAGSLVEDAPDTPGGFVGHAHIEHGVAVPEANEPWPPGLREKLDDRCKALLTVAKLHLDPNIDSEEWQGPALTAA